jgi:hypothetical protein
MSEVDREFFLQHPEAPRRLNPDDPHQASLVRQWNELFNEFLNRMVDHHFHRFFPDSPRLDPNNPEHATLIDCWTDIRDIIRDDKPPRYNWDLPPQTADASSAPASDPAEHPDPGSRPDVAVHMDENDFKEAVHLWLEGTHYLGDSAEVLGYLAEAAGASEESAVVLFGEALGPVGAIASTILVLWETVHAFGTGLRLQEQQGFCYGVMWEVCELPNGEKGFVDHFDDSAADLHDAFYEGVAAGREKGGWPSVHNRVILAVAYYQANGDDLEAARSRVLNDLWHNVRENDLGRDYLLWPTPESMQPF